MNPEITIEQKEQLNTWAGQRDAMLLEISGLRTEQEKLIITNNELSNSSSDISTRLTKTLGRIEELEKKEKELPLLISREIADLKTEKSNLQVENTSLGRINSVLYNEKLGLEASISFLTETFNTMNDRVGLLEKVVGHVTEVSDKNITTINDLISTVKTGMQELIDTNQSVVEKTNTVIGEIPKIVLESKRVSLERSVIKKQKI